MIQASNDASCELAFESNSSGSRGGLDEDRRSFALSPSPAFGNAASIQRPSGLSGDKSG